MYAYIREKKAGHRGRGGYTKEQVFSLVLRWPVRGN